MTIIYIIHFNMFHEDQKGLSTETQDMKRALDSLQEELEAVDYYNQRADACNNAELASIFRHNAKEEKEREHAS